MANEFIVKLYILKYSEMIAAEPFNVMAFFVVWAVLVISIRRNKSQMRIIQIQLRMNYEWKRYKSEKRAAVSVGRTWIVFCFEFDISYSSFVYLCALCVRSIGAANFSEIEARFEWTIPCRPTYRPFFSLNLNSKQFINAFAFNLFCEHHKTV